MLEDIETRLGFRTREQVKKLQELVENNGSDSATF
jgi:hypothetical protein